MIESGPFNPEAENKRSKKLPPAREGILKLLEGGADEASLRDRTALTNTADEEVDGIIDAAVDYVSERPEEHGLGGDFIVEAGKPRGRRVLDLSPLESSQENPFLNRICLKIVDIDPKDEKNDKERRFRSELAVHQRIQELADANPEGKLRVPRILKVIERPEKGFVGVVMERLPKNDRNNTIQTMIGDAQRDGRTLRLSDDVTADVRGAYEELHAAGFIHGDVNMGNLYLLDAESKDYALPKAPGKPRPNLRIIYTAKPVILDFELTLDPNATNESLKQKEMATFEAVTSEVELPIKKDSTLEDAIEENDGYYEKRRSKGKGA